MTSLIILLMITGTILLVIEVFVPGFGVFGISGAIALVVSSILSCINFDYDPVVIISVQLAIICVIAILTCIFFKASGIHKKLILSENLEEDKLMIDENELLNKVGITKTPLKPVGVIIVDNKNIEVLSEDGFIEKDEKVLIHRIVKNKIFVKRNMEG